MTTTLATVLAALVLAVLPPGGTFIDDDGSVHEGGIEAIAAEDITSGCNPPANTRYCPRDAVTRGQMAGFLARALGLAESPADYFVDDTGNTFEAAINKIAEAKITLGCNPPSNTRFCPDHIMTRGQMAAMLARAFHLPAASVDYFVDDTGHTFEIAINKIAEDGVTLGCNPPDNDHFCPDALVTRDQMATFLTRALNLTPTPPPPRAKPSVVVEPRQAWNAVPADFTKMTLHTVERLTIHHAGTQTGTTGPAQIKGWQNFHITGRGWGDIAYHLIIGIDGTVYEGRDRDYEGDTGTTYDTTGHFLVVVEGNFEDDQPTSAQLDSLSDVLAWAAEEYDVSPDTITGHRDHANTLCPGASLYPLIVSGQIRDDVQAHIDDGGVDLIWP